MFATPFFSGNRARALAGLALFLSFSAHADSSVLSVPAFNQVVGKLVHEVLVETQKTPNPFVQAFALKIDDAGTDLSSPDHVALKFDASAT